MVPPEKSTTALAVLAENLEKIRKATKPPLSETKFAPLVGLTQRTYNRTINQLNQTKLSTLDDIARKLGLQAWHLLMPGFEPNNPPAFLPRSPDEEKLYKGIEAAFKVIADKGLAGEN